MLWISVIVIIILVCCVWFIISVLEVMVSKFPSRLQPHEAVHVTIDKLLDVLRLSGTCPRCRKKAYIRRGTRAGKLRDLIRGKSKFMCGECRISWRRSGWIRPYGKE